MFWENFLTLCRNRNVSPSFVCTTLGLSTTLVSRWRNGSIPRDITLLKIAEYFGVPTDALTMEDIDIIKAADIAARMIQDPSLVEQIENRGVRVPVYGNVSAGIPLEAITDIDDYEDISQEMAAKGEYAALRIHGDSMEPRMRDGDIVIVRLQDTIESGETAIVMINGGDATCKKIKRTEDGIMLISTNPKYEPMFFTNKQIEGLPITIWGKVVELRAKF